MFEVIWTVWEGAMEVAPHWDTNYNLETVRLHIVKSWLQIVKNLNNEIIQIRGFTIGGGQLYTHRLPVLYIFRFRFQLLIHFPFLYLFTVSSKHFYGLFWFRFCNGFNLVIILRGDEDDPTIRHLLILFHKIVNFKNNKTWQ